MSTAPVRPTAVARRRVVGLADRAIPTVDIVIPVLNEETSLEGSVRRLHARLGGQTAFAGRIIVADNGSTDATLATAMRLAATIPGVAVLHLDERGRGRALRSAWLASTADVVAYMDVDLSTDLTQLPALVNLITDGGADVAVGSRLHRESRVTRGPRREVISRCYNRLLHTILRVGFHDAQCGFKAVRCDVARRLVPLVEDNGWFFDTELLVRAERYGYTVAELPVTWTDDPDSRVKIIGTAWTDLRGIGRLLTERLRGRATRVTRFAVVGVASTLIYAGLFVGLTPLATAVTANAVALVVSTAVNTEANRRFTFGVRGSRWRLAAHAGGVLSLLVGLLLSTAALGAVRLLSQHPALLAEEGATVTAMAIATAGRYALLRRYAMPDRPTLHQHNSSPIRPGSIAA